MPGSTFLARMRKFVGKLEQRMHNCHPRCARLKTGKASGRSHKWFHLIDELKRKIESLEENLAQCQAQKQAVEHASHAKDQVLAMVSHDLRTPLSGILLWAHALREQPGAEDDRKEAADAITRMAHEQLGLVNDLLDMSRIIHGRMTLSPARVDLRQLVREAVADVAGRGTACGRTVEMELGEPIVLEGDADRLRQVVWNLLGNAVKFTPPDGQIKIRVERAPDRVRLQVSDSGRGIPPELLARIFEPFVRGEHDRCEERKGLGLGLAIVKHIVELHGGQIRAHSEGAGRGACFEVELPVDART